ncbi:MAG TPA: hypothetical protein VII74_04510 [Chthoniobacterales bacterium]
MVCILFDHWRNASPKRKTYPRPGRVAEACLTILETAIAPGILAIVAAAVLATLIALTKNASRKAPFSLVELAVAAVILAVVARIRVLDPHGNDHASG